MVKKNIILFTQDRETLSLGHLTLCPGKFVEDLFDAVRDAETFDELTAKLETIIYTPFRVDKVTRTYIRYIVTDVYENDIFLKFKVAPQSQT